MFVPVLALAVAPFFASCETDTDDNPVLVPQQGTISLTTSADIESATLDLLNTENISVSTTTPDFGFSCVVLYQIQVSLTEDFASSLTLRNINQTASSSKSSTDITISCAELNDSIVVLYQAANGGATPTTDPMKAYIRVQSSVNGSNTGYVYSNPIELNVIAQYVEKNPSLYYIVGDMQGWGGNKNCLLYPTSTTIYSYTTQWNGSGNLKFWLDTDINNWDAAYGCAVDGSNASSGELIKSVSGSQAGAMVVPTIGEYYTFTADLANMTYTWTRLDDQNPTAYPQMSLRGDFNNWAYDTFLTEVAPHNWYTTITIPSDGEIKFCADEGWATSWGTGNGANIGEQFYGIASGADNIIIPAGTYEVYFNDITEQYVFVAAE